MITFFSQLQIAAVVTTIGMLTAVLAGGADAARAGTQLVRVRGEL